MSFSKLMWIALRSAVHYRKTGIVVALGLALAGAIICGSLIVGDCVKGSIYHIATARLGSITHAIQFPGFAREELSDEMADGLSQPNPATAVPVIIVRGFVENQSSGAAVPLVNIIGINKRFDAFFGEKVAPEPGYAAINRSLAKDLSLVDGDSILITTDRESGISAQSLFARIGPSENRRSMRMELGNILPDDRAGGFRLDASTQIPRNVFVPLDELAEVIEKPGKANTILVSTSTNTQQIAEALRGAAQIEDYGLTIEKDTTNARLIIKSDSIVMPENLTKMIDNYADSANAALQLSSVYLADRLKDFKPPLQDLHYAVIASTDPLPDFTFLSGTNIESEDDILLNKWAADDLNAQVRRTLILDYLISETNGEYTTHSTRLQIKGIVDISRAAADQSVVPNFEGITDAERIGDWNPPFPVDMARVTERDDLYWLKHKALPKAFVHPDLMKKIWREADNSQSAYVTSATLRFPEGTDVESAAIAAAKDIPGQGADSPGTVIKLKELALESAKGNTDLSGIFLGLGMLLIYASAALSGSFVRISVQSRDKNIGIMLAQGFSARQANSVVLAEWSLWSLAGSVLAVPLGALYAWGIVIALNSWWQGAVGQNVLQVHIRPISLVLGFVISFAIGIATILVALRGTTGRSTVDLLQRRTGQEEEALKRGNQLGGRGVLIGALAVLLAIVLSLFSANIGLILALPVSLIGGVLISKGAVDSYKRRKAHLSLMDLGRQRQHAWVRYDAAIQLTAAAVMLLVVSSQIRTVSKIEQNSGTGGFALRAVSALPLDYDLNTPTGRAKLGFQNTDEPAFDGVRIYSLAASEGDDISCLNLARASQPRILGVPEDFIERGGFGLEKHEWEELGSFSGGIAAIGDADSVTWNLKMKIGDSLPIGPNSEPVVIKHVIKQSVFAGELIVSLQDFKSIYPDAAKPRYYLIECPEDKIEPLAEVLRTTLGAAGMQVQSTTEIINSFMGVQNTYIAVLMALGGLALILGAGGQLLGVLRSVYQNKAEYVLLLCVGYSKRDIVKLLLIEHALLPVFSVLVSVLCCVAIMLSGWISGESVLNWRWPVLVVPSMGVVATLTCLAAAVRATKGNLIEALRTE